MTEKPVTYYFGRLNLVPVILKLDEKIKFVSEALRSNRTTSRRNHIWRFSDVTEFSNTDGLYFSGLLVKYKLQGAEEVVVPETGDITDESIQNPVVAKSRFFLHVSSGLIAYRPVSGKISESQFRDEFARLIEEAYDHFFINAEIQTVKDRVEFQETLKRTENVSRIEIYLHPSNPSIGVWKDIDRDLKDTGTISLTEIRDTNENITSGNTILTNEALLHKLLMSEDGYGEMKVKGKIDGKVRIISTRDNPVTASAPNDKNSVETVFAQLQTTIRNIFDRFEK